MQQAPDGHKQGKKLPPIIRALESRNYRLFFCAQGVSQVGLWMQKVAMGWLVYRLTDSTRALGIIDFLSSFPTVLLIPLTGYMLPRLELRKVLLVTQTLLMCCAGLIGIFTLTNVITYWLLSCIALVIGLVNAFDMPVRQSMVVYMVDDKDNMSNALALNSSLFNVARLIGPSIAGVTIHHVGEGICFLINSVAYSSTIWAVKAMRLARSTVARKNGGHGDNRSESRGEALREVFVGFRLLRLFPPFALILLLVTVTCLFGVPYLALMPAMARTVLGGTSKTMGTLLMCVGAGALVGSLLMASRKSPVGLDRWAMRCSIAFGIAVSLFALSRTVWLSMVLLAPVGFFMVTTVIACNTFLQTLVEDQYRSALMSLYVAAMTGIAPFGSILVGWMSEVIGTSMALCISGIVCVVGSFYCSHRLGRYRKYIHRAFVAHGYHLKEGRRWEWF